MRVLFVTPSVVGSGEAVTCLHIARDIRARGGEVAFLASRTTASLLRPEHPSRVVELTAELEENQRRWTDIVHQFEPSVIVFADYPLLQLGDAAPPLADARWIETIAELPTSLVTLDHVGYCQRPQLVFFGPAHRSQSSASTGTLPVSMEILLPCPINGPDTEVGRKGIPFRFVPVADELSGALRRSVRRRYLAAGTDRLIVHAAPVWSERVAVQLGLRLYDHWPRLMDVQLGDLAARTTVVSVNSGALLPGDRSRMRIVNQPSLPPFDFDLLLRSCDLFVTENKISTTLARACFGPTPAAHLSNPSRLAEVHAWPPSALRSIALEMEREDPGSIFSWEVFPIWSTSDVDELGVFHGNSYAETFESCPIFGRRGEGGAIAEVMSDPVRRSVISERRADYCERVARLPGAAEVLDMLV